MEVLRAKGANKPVNRKVRVPAELGKRLIDLESRVKDVDLEIDWDGPVVKVLTELADAVDRDLAKLASEKKSLVGELQSDEMPGV